MFERLTKCLPDLEKAEARESQAVHQEPGGAVDDSAQAPRASYGRAIMEVEQAVYAFFNEHPEYELARYSEILERNGIKWDGRAMAGADVSQLDGQAVMALLMGAVRAERFCDGALICFFEDGTVKKWLSRLQEIDGAQRP